MRRTTGLLALTAISAALAAGAAIAPAAAQIASSDEPIQITSTKDAVYSRSQGVFTFSENVRVVQGGSQLTSDSLTVYCARTEIPAAAESCDPISRIIAEGQVIYTTPNEKIRGDRAEYDYAADVITITGIVILSRGDEGVMRGTKVIYDVGRGTVAVSSENEPVFGIFNSQRPDSQRPNARPPATNN